MHSETPIWQSAVKAKHNRQRAHGRLYIQGDDVYYFPELSSASSSFRRPLLLGGGGLLFILLFLASDALASPFYGTFRTGRADPSTLVVGGVLMLAAAAYLVYEAMAARRALKLLMEEDEYLGMSLEQRYAQAPKAAKFKLADIVEVRGSRTIKVKTKVGERFTFKSVPHDPTLAQRLRGERVW